MTMIMQEFEGEEDSCNPDCSMSTDFSFILSPQSSSGADSLGKTKTTFSSMWNNLRYGNLVECGERGWGVA